jgi:hypothetical protein
MSAYLRVQPGSGGVQHVPETSSVPDDSAGLRGANAQLRELLVERDAEMGLLREQLAALPSGISKGLGMVKENPTVATLTESARVSLDALGIPLQGWSCGQPQARFKLDLAVAAGIRAKGPFDDATNKSVIKLLPRKPPAIKERPGDRRREIGYIEIRA